MQLGLLLVPVVVLSLFAGSEIKDFKNSFSFFKTDDDGGRVPTMTFWALAAFGGWMLWKKVR